MCRHSPGPWDCPPSSEIPAFLGCSLLLHSPDLLHPECDPRRRRLRLLACFREAEDLFVTHARSGDQPESSHLIQHFAGLHRVVTANVFAVDVLCLRGVIVAAHRALIWASERCVPASCGILLRASSAAASAACSAASAAFAAACSAASSRSSFVGESVRSRVLDDDQPSDFDVLEVVVAIDDLGERKAVFQALSASIWERHFHYCRIDCRCLASRCSVRRRFLRDSS